MKRLTSDNKMLGYELMKAYPNISCFLPPVTEVVVRETTLRSIVTDIAGTRQEM